MEDRRKRIDIEKGILYFDDCALFNAIIYSNLQAGQPLHKDVIDVAKACQTEIKMVELLRYSSELKKEWDGFIRTSKNGTFILFRDYMDYHSDRFTDLSLMFRIKGKLGALLPGNVSDGKYYSHQGLTYGGLITSYSIKTTDIIEIFRIVVSYLSSVGVTEIIYKASPYFYHHAPAQEDIYALYCAGAIKADCKISSVIYQSNKIGFKESRNGGVRKSIKNKIVISESDSYEKFWKILEENLLFRYNTRPVHSVNEIILLSKRFPENIKLYTAELGNEMIAGTVLYINPGSVHVQYISSNESGREIGALDLLFDKLINEIYVSVPVFDFGTSNGAQGQSLVQELLFQKEGFGGRGVVYESYKLSI